MGLKGPSTLLGTKGSPGPGAYQIKSTLNSIVGAKIGSSKRDDDF